MDAWEWGTKMRRNVPFSTENHERTSHQFGNAAIMEETAYIAQQYKSTLNASLCSYEYILSYPVHVLYYRTHPYHTSKIHHPSYLQSYSGRKKFFFLFQPCLQRRCSTVKFRSSKSQSCQRTKYKIRILTHLFLFFFIIIFYHSLLYRNRTRITLNLIGLIQY